MVEVFLLAVASALWPALVAVVVVALRTPRPARILASFLAAGLLTTVSIGVAIVYVLETSDVVEGPHRTTNAVVDLTIGVLALVAAYVFARRPAAAKPASADRAGWSERMIERGARLAFVVGVVLNLFPGLFPFVALKDIAGLDYAAGATVLVVLGFYVVMFAIVEVPLVALLVAPERATSLVGAFNRWLERNGREVVVVALAAVGAYLVVRGILAAVR